MALWIIASIVAAFALLVIELSNVALMISPREGDVVAVITLEFPVMPVAS